ncbi:PKD domain-containing protein [Methanosarcina mazei]|uniref:PKD domain-containing protein n=1 Tax=Methanosarcina mazei TaxID=2209 RepID=UPI003C71501A
MKHEFDALVKTISIFFAAFVLFSSFTLPVCAENEMVPGTALKNNSTMTIPRTLVRGDSGTSLQPMITETGKINLSVDGLGTDSSGIIQVEKPEGATVRSAYLIAAGMWGSQIPEGSVLINGSAVYWNNTVFSTACYNYWADVTSIVKPAVDIAPAGRVNFTVTETSPYSSDGEVLAVIFDDPDQKEDNTVILLFGGQNPAGDTFSIKLSDPVDKNDSNFAIDMGLGISFSYQNSGGSQVSNVNVNGVRVTSSAGGEDDGFSGNGALLTVGGLDDSTANPLDPYAGPSNPRTDDELYNLLPFVNSGDSNITVFTQNPSNDDNIFFSYFFLRSSTAMVGEGILLSPASGNASVGSQYTLSSLVQDDNGNPLAGKPVSFSVVSGPNAGQSGTAITDAAGRANFTCSGTSTGTDIIEASFVNNAGETIVSNRASIEWIVPHVPSPAADFNSNVTLGVQPLTVEFYDLSENAVSWNWYFGDGNSSELQNCTHTYFDPGYYTVSLTVNNLAGSSNTTIREDYIFVQMRPIPGFIANVTEGTFPLTVQFTDESQYSESVEWNFGDGNISTEPNPVHTYSEAGLYSVSLSSTGNNTSVTKNIDNYINVTTSPVPDFTANITAGTLPLSVQFIDESQYAESVEWDFGDGNSSTDRNPAHTYSESGLYTVSLTATGNGTSVVKTVVDYINVTIPPVPDFSANVTVGTLPLTVQFSDNSTYTESVEWDFGDGNSSSERNPVHTYTVAGLYSVSLTATGNNTSVTKTVNEFINVTIPPIPNFSVNTTEGTFPLTVQFIDESQYSEIVEWNFGDGGSSTDRNPVHTYSEAGLYSISLVATGNGTSVTKTVDDFINVTTPPVPDFITNVTEGTFPLTVQFTDNSSYAESVVWDFGDGNSSSERNPVHTFTASGLYTVSLTATGNNTSVTKIADDFINVTIPPVPDFSANITEGLYPLSVQFTDNSSYAESLEWDFGDGNTSTDLSPLHTYSEAGLYTVSLTATGNRTSVTKTAEDYINVTLPPILDFGANVTTGPYPLTVQFMDNSSHAGSVLWDFGDGSVSNERNPVHTYEECGLYTVTLGAGGNGTTVNKTVQDFINVTIQPFPPEANFSVNVTRGPAPLTVSFSDESYNSVSCEWDIDGDGQADYTEANPVHTYKNAGIYNVSLYVSNAYGNDTEVVKGCINVLAHPVVSERNLSKTSVYPGEEFIVNLNIESAWNLTNLTVVEDIPAGWNLTPIDNAGAEFNSTSNKWIWENYSAGDRRQLVYVLKAPLDSDFGTFKLEGDVLAENVVAIPVEGESEITITPIADYNPENLKLLHVGDPDQEFNISTHVLCNFTWYVNGNESSEGDKKNSAYASLTLSPETLWRNDHFKNSYTSVENSGLFAGKYSVTCRVSNRSTAINQTWNFLITRSAESKNNINNTVVLPVRKVEENESVSFNFTEEPDNTDDNSILAISFNASSTGNVSVFVEVLKDRASEVTKNPEGEVFQHINIHFSNHTVMNETGSDSKFIDFKVNRAWMETVVKGTVRLNRYQNGEWQPLNTWETSSDAEYHYFRAETPGFSPFSVTAEKISTPSVSTPHKGGSGTGSVTIISSTKVEDENISGAENEGADSTLSKGAEDILVSQSTDTGKSIFVEEGNGSEAAGSEENNGSEKSGSTGVLFFILLVLFIVGAYLVYRQTKEEE